MKLLIDTDTRQIACESETQQLQLQLYSREAFELISELWLKVGWNQKYTYTFTWLGRPVIQLPADMVRIQEVIYQVQPDVIVETGIAHGGSLVFYASLCKAIGKGRVIGIDIDIRPHNRRAIEQHELFSLISLVEGDSVSPEVIRLVKSLVRPEESALVVLDSRHSKEHVLAELDAYHDLVGPGSCLVATDGIMEQLHDVPRGSPVWASDNPAAAVLEFAGQHPEFELEQPPWPFNESDLRRSVTHWPAAWLRRR